MTRIINGYSIVSAIDEAVNERGDNFVYQEHFEDIGTCKYVVGDEPACIVGKALIDYLDIDFPKDDGVYRNGSITYLHEEIEKYADVKFTAEAVVIMAVAQGVQDAKGTWGLALVAARKALVAFEYTAGKELTDTSSED